jgi:hypothetical protein
MMKHDKKIQRVAANLNERVVVMNVEDDIVRNMTNLILNKNDKAGFGVGGGSSMWDRSLLGMDTAANSTVMHNTSAALTRGQKGLGSKKLNSGAGGAAAENKLSMLMNPMVESFLSFNIGASNATNMQTNANITAQFPSGNQAGTNLFD